MKLVQGSWVSVPDPAATSILQRKRVTIGPRQAARGRNCRFYSLLRVSDCETGAVLPLGAGYALECIVVDENLEGERDAYLEGGDHRTLIHLTGQQFHDGE